MIMVGEKPGQSGHCFLITWFYEIFKEEFLNRGWNNKIKKKDVSFYFILNLNFLIAGNVYVIYSERCLVIPSTYGTTKYWVRYLQTR